RGSAQAARAGVRGVRRRRPSTAIQLRHDVHLRTAMLDKAEAKTQAFRLEEATIDDLHAAILSGATTVVAVVQCYLARVRAYNGVASMLMTQDGAPVAEVPGVTRAGKALKFPTQTLKASTILPDLDKYKGPPL